MNVANRAILLKVFSHQRLPYDILSRDLKPPKDRSSKGLSEDTCAVGQVAEEGTQNSGSGLPTSTQEDENGLLRRFNDTDTVDPSLDESHIPEFGGWEGIEHSGSWGDVHTDFLSCNDGLQPMDDQTEVNMDFTLPVESGSGAGGLEGSASQRQDHYDSDGDSDNTEALANQLSERIGSLHIGPIGNIRFLGPTSYFSLIKAPCTESLGVQQTKTHNNQDHLSRLGLGKRVPSSLEEHLTNLYFAWQDPSLHVVDRPMYESAKARRRNGEETPYYSESLQNAMYGDVHC